MTTGIYCLTFENTDYVYIGQSINIEKRYQEHLTELRSGTANFKMLAAYTLFSAPTLNILEECEEGDLNQVELEYMLEFNSVEKGLNCIYGNTPRSEIRKGYIPKNSKYKEEVYFSILKACIEFPDKSNSFIASLTDTDNISVSRIRTLKSHKWMSTKYPEEYNILINLVSSKSIVYKDRDIKNTNTKKLKPPEYYPEIVSPDGITYRLEKGLANKFSKTNNLNYTALNKVLNGKLEHHRGWKLKL